MYTHHRHGYPGLYEARHSQTKESNYQDVLYYYTKKIMGQKQVMLLVSMTQHYINTATFRQLRNLSQNLLVLIIDGAGLYIIDHEETEFSP